MPRADLTVTAISRTGVAPPAETTGDPVNNHTVNNDGSVFLLARNSNSGSTARTVTVHVNKTIDGQAVASKTYSIPASSSLYIGPFPPETYGADLLVDVDNAELKLSAFHLA